MAWRAMLESITDNVSPGEEILLHIRFREDVTGKQFTKEYKFTYQSLPNAATLRNFALSEVAKLTAFDNTKAILQGSVGIEI